MLKNLAILTILTILIILAIFQKPEYIKVNIEGTQACTIDMAIDSDLLCD